MSYFILKIKNNLFLIKMYNSEISYEYRKQFWERQAMTSSEVRMQLHDS